MNAASLMASPADDIARHLTAPRLAVLEILASGGPTDEAGIREAWRAIRPDMSPRHVSALPRMIRHLLWRLELLGWVAEGDRGFELTHRGRTIVEDRAGSTDLG
ncbi:hypothetical protein [Agromyces sp. NPDC049794]|uniref:hypothetical protein n=1 Tax=unclassified Agromyces TaxID=2639701 RepID=UPI0033CEF5B2